MLRPPFASGFARLLPHDHASYDGAVPRDDRWDGYRADPDPPADGLARRRADGGRTVLPGGRRARFVGLRP